MRDEKIFLSENTYFLVTQVQQGDLPFSRYFFILILSKNRRFSLIKNLFFSNTSTTRRFSFHNILLNPNFMHDYKIFLNENAYFLVIQAQQVIQVQLLLSQDIFSS
jgi:hypothetical protein